MARIPSFATRPAPQHGGPSTIESLSTTTEGLWLLQALCGVETLPSVLVTRPYIADVAAPTSHPGIDTLREAGAVLAGDNYSVHPQIGQWLETLGAPDVVLCCMIQRRAGLTGGNSHLRVAIARRGTMTVAAARHADEVTVENVGAVPNMRALLSRLLPLCGPEVKPAEFEAIMVPTSDLLDGLAQVVRGDHTPKVALGRLGLDSTQQRIITAAADHPHMEMSVAVIRHDNKGDHVGIATVAIADTAEGRIITGPVRSDSGAWWTMVTPGTVAAGARALTNLLETVGLSDWNSHDRSA